MGAMSWRESVLALLVLFALALWIPGGSYIDPTLAAFVVLSLMLILMSLVAIYFLSHYMFASLTAHTTAMLPMMLAAGPAIPGLSAATLAMGLALTTGIMGVLTPYATGAALPYYNRGYLTPAQFWRLGAIFGLIFIEALPGVGIPLLAR